MSPVNGKYKIINNRLFNKLWTLASKTNGKNQYIQMLTSALSEDYIDFKKKCGIKYEESILLLNEIYEKNHMTFKEILELAGVRKADIANVFCIPIRTVEEWYAGNNPCAGYIKLMILRHYKLINLGKYIHLESDVEYQKNIIPVYQKKTKECKELNDSPFDDSDDSNSEIEEIDILLKEFQQKREQRERAIEQFQTSDILSKTSFIDDILKRTNKNSN